LRAVAIAVQNSERVHGMSGGALLVDRPLPGVVVLTLNRPAKRNALSKALMADLVRALQAIGADDANRCAVLTGTPPAFCAGGDLAELQYADDEAYAVYCGAYRAIAVAIRDLPFPLIAAVNGAAVAGGFELMCLADLRVLADDATILTGDAELGLPPTSGLSWLLPRLVGAGRARWLTMVEPRLTGAEAYAIGLAEELRPAAEVLPRAVEMAATVAAKPGDGIRLTRRTIERALETGHLAAIDHELDAQREAYGNPAVRQAFAAFFDRP
jgi:enoyl-CoA hydratase/carnithine racemase